MRAANGVEAELPPGRSNVLLLIDTSRSMAGAKLEQAKSGAIDFAHCAIRKGYATALAVFANRAAVVCDATIDSAYFASRVTQLEVGVMGVTTDLAAALILADKIAELAVVVVVTDGATAQEPALRSAATLKDKNVEILCIGTDDADAKFLKGLATRSDLATYVRSQDLRSAIDGASRLLEAKQSARILITPSSVFPRARRKMRSREPTGT